MSDETISVKVELVGVRPATFRLRWKAEDSYDLYRGSRKLGTARVEESREWTARFEHDGKAWIARADAAPELLHLVGTYILAHEARRSPPADAPPPAGKASAAERRLSEEWLELQEKRRAAALDILIKNARKQIVPAKK